MFPDPEEFVDSVDSVNSNNSTYRGCSAFCCKYKIQCEQKNTNINLKIGEDKMVKIMQCIDKHFKDKKFWLCECSIRIENAVIKNKDTVYSLDVFIDNSFDKHKRCTKNVTPTVNPIASVANSMSSPMHLGTPVISSVTSVTNPMSSPMHFDASMLNQSFLNPSLGIHQQMLNQHQPSLNQQMLNPSFLNPSLGIHQQMLNQQFLNQSFLNPSLGIHQQMLNQQMMDQQLMSNQTSMSNQNLKHMIKADPKSQIVCNNYPLCQFDTNCHYLHPRDDLNSKCIDVSCELNNFLQPIKGVSALERCTKIKQLSNDLNSLMNEALVTIQQCNMCLSTNSNNFQSNGKSNVVKNFERSKTPNRIQNLKQHQNQNQSQSQNQRQQYQRQQNQPIQRQQQQNQ